MKRKGLALSRRLASSLLAATLAAGLAAPQAAVYAGEPDAVLEEETGSGEDIYTSPDEDVPEETEDPSLDLYPDAAVIHMSMLLRILTLRKMQRMQMRR